MPHVYVVVLSCCPCSYSRWSSAAVKARQHLGMCFTTTSNSLYEVAKAALPASGWSPLNKHELLQLLHQPPLHLRQTLVLLVTIILCYCHFQILYNLSASGWYIQVYSSYVHRCLDSYVQMGYEIGNSGLSLVINVWHYKKTILAVFWYLIS